VGGVQGHSICVVVVVSVEGISIMGEAKGINSKLIMGEKSDPDKLLTC
jgi:hypothetical protein